MNKKIISLFIVGIFLLATFGSVSANPKKNVEVPSRKEINEKIAIVESWIDENSPKDAVVAFQEAKNLLEVSEIYLQRGNVTQSNQTLILADAQINKAIEILEKTFISGKTKTLTKTLKIPAPTVLSGNGYLVVDYILQWTPYYNIWHKVTKVVWEYQASSTLYNDTPWAWSHIVTGYADGNSFRIDVYKKSSNNFVSAYKSKTKYYTNWTGEYVTCKATGTCDAVLSGPLEETAGPTDWWCDAD